jgi:hypothetical protein
MLFKPQDSRNIFGVKVLQSKFVKYRESLCYTKRMLNDDDERWENDRTSSSLALAAKINLSVCSSSFF